jgi:D-amino-acid dehydrogenase
LGVVFPWAFPGSHPGWVALSEHGSGYLPGLLRELETAGQTTHGVEQVGGLSLLVDPQDAAALDPMMAAMAQQPGHSGMGVGHTLAPGQPAEQVPVLHEKYSGYHLPGVFRVDGSVLCESVWRTAAAAGAERRTGTATLRPRLGSAELRVNGEQLDVDVVVVAAGAWSAGLCRPLGASLPVAPRAGMVVHLRLSEVMADTWPVIRTTDEHWIVGFPGDRISVGSTSSDAGFDTRVTAGALHELLSAAAVAAPGLASAELLGTSVGLRPSTADGLPVLGRLDAASNVVVATGLGGLGLTFGPYLGSLAARIARGQSVGLDVTPYRPER